MGCGGREGKSSRRSVEEEWHKKEAKISSTPCFLARAIFNSRKLDLDYVCGVVCESCANVPPLACRAPRHHHPPAMSFEAHREKPISLMGFQGSREAHWWMRKILICFGKCLNFQAIRIPEMVLFQTHAVDLN